MEPKEGAGPTEGTEEGTGPTEGTEERTGPTEPRRARLRPPFDDSWSLFDVSKRWRPAGWQKVFEDAEPEIENTSEKLAGQTFYPDIRLVFSAFDHTPLSRVRVVLLGMDPYPGEDEQGRPLATGLSFSVRRGVAPPSSLENIYAELERSVDGFDPPRHGDLTSWAKQGVLLLNTALTVTPGNPGSHINHWLGLMARVVSAVCNERPMCVFLALGRKAQDFAKKMVKGCVVIDAPHPSARNLHGAFVGCNVFAKCNRALAKANQTPVDWRLPH